MASLAGITALSSCGGGQKPVASSPTTPVSSSAPTPSLTVSATLPAGTQGAAYNGSVTASGGASPYNYSVTSGQMPQGVSLNSSTGAVSGTPTAAGNFNFGVSVSDAKGDSKQQSLQIAIAQAAAPAPSPSPSPAPSGNQSAGTALSNLQKAGGWGQYGQGPPNFVDCSPSPCDGIQFSMSQNNSSPSLSGSSTVFWVGGTTPYSDALWNNHLIGPLSSQGMFDQNQSQLPNLHNFTYDVYFYGDNLGISQALEFDINEFFGNMGFIFGHECRIAAGNQWDVWDNSKGHWIPTGVPCYPMSGQWNHLTIKVQRTSDNHETYKSITLNGQTANLNWTFDKGTSPGWYGLTVNFQMDGNPNQDAYKVYLDNLTLTYQ
ncbi:MAG: Ig domain-containing protein [Candidatus Sulfotelmatobacter sp.]